MGVLNGVSDTEVKKKSGEDNPPGQKKRASFPSRERHYAVRRKTRTNSPPFHKCNRVPPQLPPAELPCDCEDDEQRQ
ncbi:hypothetical protein L9F63_022127, partial [Diploptera punctata]